jgi:hypothetical protein
MKNKKTVRTVVQKFCDDANALLNSIEDLRKISPSKDMDRRLSLLVEKIGGVSKSLEKSSGPLVKRANEIVE